MSTSPQVNKLRAAMQGMAGTPEPVAPPTMEPPRPMLAPRAPSRRGKRVVSAYVDAAAAKQLRILAAERETSTQALVEEALNDLFRKHSRSAVA